MFRVSCALAAVFALMAISAAQAQPKVCKKVDVSFACRNGGSGTATFNCRGGETEAQCCGRLRKRAADPRRGWCTGRNNGLVSFKCGCAKKKGGREFGRLRRPDRLGTAETAPSAGDGAKRGKVEFEWKVEEGESAKSGPRLKAAGPQGQGARRCPRVDYAFSCRGTGSGSGKARCRRGEGERRCCARVRKSVQASCARNGGVARFKCGCPRDQRPGRTERLR